MDAGQRQFDAMITVDEWDKKAYDMVTDLGKRSQDKLHNVWAYVCCILNIVLPGTGTMLYACLSNENMNKT